MNKTTLTISEGTREIGSILAEIEEIVIPGGVERIGVSAFDGCLSLTKTTIPDSVTHIGDHAFFDCVSLKEINIPNSVTEIGDSAFNGCESLKEINIPNSVTEIGYYAFYCCDSLKAIYIDKEKDTLDLIDTMIPEDCKVYWKGEWEKEAEK